MTLFMQSNEKARTESLLDQGTGRVEQIYPNLINFAYFELENS